MSASNTKSPQKQSAGHRGLLFVVISMGIALVGGMALLVAKLVAAPNSAGGCKPQHYALAADEFAKVLQADKQTATLEIVSSEPGKSIRVIDLCSGAELRELSIGH